MPETPDAKPRTEPCKRCGEPIFLARRQNRTTVALDSAPAEDGRFVVRPGPTPFCYSLDSAEDREIANGSKDPTYDRHRC